MPRESAKTESDPFTCPPFAVWRELVDSTQVAMGGPHERKVGK